MGFKLKKLAAPIANTVKQATSTVSNVAKGDFKEAGKSAVATVASVNPVAQLEKIAGTNITGLSGIASGDLSSENLKKLGLTTAAAGATVVGGPAAGAAVYSGGNQLLRGNLAGGASTIAGGMGSMNSLLPEGLIPSSSLGFGEFGNLAKSLFANAKIGSRPSQDPFEIASPSLARAPSGEADPTSFLIAAVILGAGSIFAFKHLRR